MDFVHFLLCVFAMFMSLHMFDVSKLGHVISQPATVAVENDDKTSVASPSETVTTPLSTSAG